MFLVYQEDISHDCVHVQLNDNKRHMRACVAPLARITRFDPSEKVMLSKI